MAYKNSINDAQERGEWEKALENWEKETQKTITITPNTAAKLSEIFTEEQAAFLMKIAKKDGVLDAYMWAQSYALLKETDENREDLHRKILEAFTATEITGFVDETDQTFLAPLTPIAALDTQLMARSRVFKAQAEIAAALNGQMTLDVGGKGRKNAKVSASITTKDGTPLQEKLSNFDREIQNVVGTLVMENGPGVYTPEQIWREFAGLPNGSKVTEKTAQEVTDAIRRMMGITCIVDFTEQFNNHIGKAGYAKVRGDLIAADEVIASYNGQNEKVAFRMLRLPVLFEYSEKLNQVTRTKKKIIDTTLNEETAKLSGPQKTRNTDTYFGLLKRYIAQEISSMKGTPGRSNSMRYETIAANVDLIEPSPKKLRNLRDDVDYYLSFLQSMGEIKAFAKYKEGRSFVGVRIYF